VNGPYILSNKGELVTVETSDTNKEETRLAKAYEAIRRREYELITDLLDLLPKIDALDPEHISQVRDALFHADHPFLMVFVGPFSSGKSSIINALLGADKLLSVGPVPTTDRINILRWGEEVQLMESGGEVATVFHPSPLLKKVSFVDTPGLESVFQKHEEITRKFLHRSDVVILVMLATQAMTKRNVDYLQKLREYGKKIIVIVNQSDLLSEEESETIRQYVLEQSQDRLNFKPEIWLTSAQKGISAREGNAIDEELWQESGIPQIEAYIDQQLNDVERLRQKLKTPLQIIQNTHNVAWEAVKANQATLDQYQSIAENVQQQLTGYKREQDRNVREINEELTVKFQEVIDRSGEAIHDIFRLSRGFGSVRRGLMSLTGLSRLFRRGDAQSYTRLAFERYKVYEPISELSETVNKIGPRLEGKDLQDIDDLVKYSRKEIGALPPNIRSKVIGNIQPPSRYDREALQAVRPDLEVIENESREIETEKLEKTFSNVWFGLAIWELVIIAGLLAIAGGGAVDASEPASYGVVIMIMALGLIGLLLMPVVGRILNVGHTNRLLKAQTQYIEILTKAADKQVDYGMQLRRDVVAPLTRLVETQTEIQTEQMNKLQATEHEMTSIEEELTKFGKRRLFG
jgi:ribosome biogenesis GTPase A